MSLFKESCRTLPEMDWNVSRGEEFAFLLGTKWIQPAEDVKEVSFCHDHRRASSLVPCVFLCHGLLMCLCVWASKVVIGFCDLSFMFSELFLPHTSVSMSCIIWVHPVNTVSHSVLLIDLTSIVLTLLQYSIQQSVTKPKEAVGNGKKSSENITYRLLKIINRNGMLCIYVWYACNVMAINDDQQKKQRHKNTK